MLYGLHTAKTWSLLGTAPSIMYFAFHTSKSVILTHIHFHSTLFLLI
jgi:hypothetical protein